MNRPVSNIRDELVGRLNLLVGSTESIYYHLGGMYPEIVHEMERSLAESSASLASLKKGSSLESFVEEIKGMIKAFMNRLSEVFGDMTMLDSQALNDLNYAIERLSSFEATITRIKEDSEEMEIISLNAMTAAIKSGTSGRAFSIITDELKRLSVRTIGLSDDLTTEERAILSSFDELRTSLEEVESYREEIIETIGGRLSEGLRELDAGMGDIVSFFSSLVERSRMVGEPVTALMEGIQLQDLIRQSTDHAVMVLCELKDIPEMSGADEIVDDWYFIKLLVELCRSVLDDVDKRLAESIGRFETSIDSINKAIADVEDQRQRFSLLSDSTASGDGNDSLATRIEHFSDLVDSVMRDADRYLDMKDQVLRRCATLSGVVKGMEGRFKSFAQVIARFRSVNVASRIESAKNQRITGIRDTVQEMSTLTARIEKDVSSAIDTTSSFIEETGKTVATFSDQHSNELETIGRIESDIRISFGNVSRIKGMVGEQAQGFSLYTGRFVDLIASSRTDVTNLGGLRTEIAGIDATLADLREEAVRNIRASGHDPDAAHDSLRNERLKDIIHRFTILTHKQAAGELGHFEVESGAASGDITFF